MQHERIRRAHLADRIVSPEQAAALIDDGMTVGMSGFTHAGDCKAVPLALAERAARDPLKITLMTGASLGNDVDKILAEANVIGRRIPFQSDSTLRRKINAGEVMFIDQHLSETVKQRRGRQLPPVDVTVIEATAITEQGGIVPTTSVGNSASFAILAPKVIVELNMKMPSALEGLHDVYIPTYRPYRTSMGGDISSIVPFVAHVDHAKHDVDVIATEQGLADLRGLAPRERASVIIENCVHPLYRDARKRGGQTPHLLEEAIAGHAGYRDAGTMRATSSGPVA